MKERIKQVMESQHMTQQVFAEFIGIAPASLSSIFTGRTRPTLQVVFAIKNKIPNISTDWLMFGSGDMYEQQGDGVATPPQEMPHGGASERPLLFDDANMAVDAAPIAQKMQLHVADEQRQVMKVVDKPQRKITEIRIFYDDQTWETFVPKK